MRLIDADDLKKTWYKEHNIEPGESGAMFVGNNEVPRFIDRARTIDAVPVEIVCEMFGNEAPCNYGLFGVSVDDFMMSKCGKWCEDNCDKVPYTECWRKFFEAIEKWRKHNG